MTKQNWKQALELIFFCEKNTEPTLDYKKTLEQLASGAATFEDGKLRWSEPKLTKKQEKERIINDAARHACEALPHTLSEKAYVKAAFRMFSAIAIDSPKLFRAALLREATSVTLPNGEEGEKPFRPSVATIKESEINPALVPWFESKGGEVKSLPPQEF